MEELIDGNDFQYGFIRGLFDNLDKASIEFDENFWQNVFRLEAYQYNGIPIYLDGEKVAEEYLRSLSAASQEEDGTNTFTIIESDQGTYQGDDTVEIYPTYYNVTIKDDNRQVALNDVCLYLNQDESYVRIGNEFENVDDKIKSDEKNSTEILFETVLDYYGLLQEDKQDYYFGKQEIVFLYSKYTQDISINKDSMGNKLESKRLHN